MRANTNNPLQIASINTLVKRLNEYDNTQVVVFDEAHHVSSNTWAMVSNHYPNAIHIGLSATPCRLDGKPLSGFFDVMVEETSTKELIKDGYLVPFKYYAPSVLDERDLVLGSNGEYTKKSIEKTISGSAVIGNNITIYKEKFNGKRNIVFAVNRKHGEDICKRYNEAGIKCEYLDGTNTQRERDDILSRFDKGITKVLVNVDLFGEGFDLPAIEVVSLLRPTHSTALYLQQVGRALRPCKEIGKQEAIILDHVNNYKRHGFPDDEREWSLDGTIKTKKATESTIALKRCPNCFQVHKPALSCPNCGYIYPRDGKIIEEINGNLVLVGSSEEKEEKRKEVLLVKTFKELVNIEKKRGYKFGWAENQWRLKTGENLWDSLKGLQQIESSRGYMRGWAFRQKMMRKQKYGY